VATRGQFEDEMQQKAKEWWVKKKRQDCSKHESDAASSDGHIKNENKQSRLVT
jgi:hypothetical protein